jgi:hypothetical protein
MQDKYSNGGGKGNGKGYSETASPEQVEHPPPEQIVQPCVGDVITINRSVVVDYIGNPDLVLDNDQLWALEKGFQAAYNRLAEALCEGGSCRVFSQVSTENFTLSQQRLLQLSGLNPSALFRAFRLFFSINFQCNGCLSDDNSSTMMQPTEFCRNIISIVV